MAISFTPLASGSKGNSILVSNENHKFLIDCGLCFRDLKNRLNSIDVHLEDIEAVVITHEHIDHIKAARLLSENCRMPIFARSEAMDEIFSRVGLFHGFCFEKGDSLSVGDIEIVPFDTPHDAVAPVGFMVSDHNSRAVYATDLGKITMELMDVTRGADLVMIESNYDPYMLAHGPYPAYLKKRIGSDVGHLSNDACSAALIEMLNRGTQKFILGHLSENNNTRDKVESKLSYVMNSVGASVGKDLLATIAYQHKVSDFICC